VTRSADWAAGNDGVLSACIGRITPRVLCLPVQSTSERQTRGAEPWHCPPRGEGEAHTRHPCHAKRSAQAPAKPCLIATFL
jgi:hypothetical protein